MAPADSRGEGAPHTACPQCTHHFYQSHGQGQYVPSFYSFVLPSPHSMPIPAAFLTGRGIKVDRESAEHEPLHSEVELAGPSGEKWNVSLQGRTLVSLAFTKGWAEFVTDHGLSVGDLLLFKLISKGFFSVTIYGNDGCEKEDLISVKNRQASLNAKANGSQKRAAAEKEIDCKTADMVTKRRKVESDKIITPSIINIDDDEDQEDDLIIINSGDSSGNANPTVGDDGSSVKHSDNNLCEQTEQAGTSVQHISASSMADTEQMTSCAPTNTKGDTPSQPNLVELPPTPNNADKSTVPPILKLVIDPQADSSNVESRTSKEESSTEPSEQETSTSDESSDEDYHIPDDSMNKEDKCLPKKADDMEFPHSLDLSSQHDRLEAFLAKDYITESFISKRRPVSDEERQKALLAAKDFKSDRPHTLKLMKESHVYRGFWLSLDTDFSSKYLPSEIQEVALLDTLGKSWSARWLGGRNGLSGGWRKFSLDHGLEEGDICVFEVLKNSKKVVIKIHIFRVIPLRNETPGRDHYLHKPPGKAIHGISCRKPATSYSTRKGVQSSSDQAPTCSKCKGAKSSGPVKKMRGAVTSKNMCHVTEDTSCVCTTPIRETKRENVRLHHLVRTASRQLEPLFERREKPLPQPAPKLASTPKEVACDANAVVPITKYYAVERLFNRRKGVEEDEFLVELECKETCTPSSSRVKREGSAWWIPLSHFTKDKMSCHL